MAWFLVLFIFLNVVPSVRAEEETDEEETINLVDTFYVITSKEDRSMIVPFSRSWFENDARIYNHNLAKLSLGLATSAFRPNKDLVVSSRPADYNLRHFLYQAGFDDLRSDDYDKDPSMYTVSTVMGHQTVGEGDDAFELIAVGICGQGYMDEWESNLTIGRGKNPEGFYNASHLVYDRVFGYISENHLRGKMKIWISGFSRAAAVSNITASLLSDSDTFSQETVFAYTFATPRTVRDMDPKPYENIFNICGKMDPVTNIPFADWGYSRYGVTYYTPALETDSDFLAKREKADKVYEELTRIPYWNNADMNSQLRILMDSLLSICPDAETYRTNLQDNLISLWEKHDALSILTRLLDMGDNPILINEENRQDANILMNQLAYFFIDYLGSDNSFRRYNQKASVGSNFLQAHTPELYVSWIFSADDPEEIYSESSGYTQLYIDGDNDVSLYKEGELLETYSFGDQIDPSKYHYIGMNNIKISVLIPRDADYMVSVVSNDDQKISAMEADFQTGQHAPDVTYKYTYGMKTGDKISLVFSVDGTSLYPEGSDSDVLEVEFTTERNITGSNLVNYLYRNWEGVTWRGLVLTFLVMAIIFVSFFVFLVTLLMMWLRFRHKRKRGFIPGNIRFRPLPVICFFLIQQAFLIKEFYTALYDLQPDVVNHFKCVIGVLVLVIALYGYRRKKDRFHLLIMPSVLFLTGADLVMTTSIATGALLYIGAYLVLCYNYISVDRPGKSQILGWILMSLAGTYLIMKVKGDFGWLRYLAVIYIVTGSALVAFSFTRSARTSRGSILLFAAGILLILNTARGSNFLFHLVASGVYYIAVTTLASTGSGFARPRIIPGYLTEAEQEPASDAAS